METSFSSEGRKLNVILHSASLPAAAGSFFGKVQRPCDTLTLENLISHIQEHETSVRPLTIQYCAGLLKTEILRQLATGCAINVLDLCTVYLAVRGSVPGESPNVSGVQSLAVRCTPTAELRAVADGLSVASVQKADTSGMIGSIKDLFTGTDNSIISSGKALRVSGTRLRVSGMLPEVGIYLVSSTDETIRIKVPAAYITRNDPSVLEFFVPDTITAGQTYYLELVTQATTSQTVFLKESRTIRFDTVLTVA